MPVTSLKTAADTPIGQAAKEGDPRASLAAFMHAVDGAGAGAEGCYRASMDDEWRVCIAFGVLPRSLHSFRQALISAAQVAREVLARHDVSAPVRTEFWSRAVAPPGRPHEPRLVRKIFLQNGPWLTLTQG